MMLTFDIENFRSVDECQSISLVADENETSHIDHLVSLPGRHEYVSRIGAIYGANAAGKSTFCKAMAFLRELVLFGVAKASGGMPRPYFAFASDGERPTILDIRFMRTNHLYRYYVVIDDYGVLYEKFIDETGGQEAMVYERGVEDERGAVSFVELGDVQGRSFSQRIRALAMAGLPRGKTFSSAIAEWMSKDEPLFAIGDLLGWFEDLTVIAPEDAAVFGNQLSSDDGIVHFVGEKLSRWSTGITDIIGKAEEVSPQEFSKAKEKAANLLASHIDETGFDLVEGGDFYRFECKNGRCFRKCIRTRHGAYGDLSLPKESDGTYRLLKLLPALYSLIHEYGVFVVDEIDRSMHPLLTLELVRTFLRTGARGQLILTTHDSNLMDGNLFRRDEIWFAEKDRKQRTHYYSLMEFPPRVNKNQGDYYLEGRFGAIPIVTSWKILGQDVVEDK